MNPFSNKVAIVTGGGSGIGREICLYLGRHGSWVFVVDLDSDGARQTESEILAEGCRGKTLHADVSRLEDIQAVVDAVLKETGRIDYLFNNAGISVNGEFQDISLEHWKRIVDVDVWGVVYGCHCAYPVMVRQGYGHIVNTASLAGLIPGGLTTPYSASKHAVVGFSLTLRGEAKAHGVCVSALCPGFMRTKILKTTPVVTGYLSSEKNKEIDAGMRYPTPKDCIRQIMRGVKRKKGIIFSPNRNLIFWWLNRIAPGFIPSMWGIIIKHLRKNA
jgi:NAD(P)-dependent dehydrogenase (short-subunit alcohol dehydrogenase family)